jgi:hypothetical protein
MLKQNFLLRKKEHVILLTNNKIKKVFFIKKTKTKT